MLTELRKSMHFYTLTVKYQKEKSRNSPIYNCIKKNKMPRNKFNQGGKRLMKNFKTFVWPTIPQNINKQIRKDIYNPQIMLSR